MTNKSAIIIFVKAPELGKVKTRIAETEGDEEALRIYKALLHHTKSIALQSSINKYLFYAFHIIEDDDWDGSIFHKKLQIEGNLGDKMKAAFKIVLKDHDSAIIIGSDCGELVLEDLERAEAALTQSDIVIGPAEDGGYYLLGMNTLHQEIFDNKTWSEEILFEETMDTCDELDLAVQLLDLKSDVDYIEDWEQVKDMVIVE